MLSKRKLKYLAKNLSAALQAEINPLVNKVGVQEYQKDPPSLIYPMYLNPLSSSYQRASLSHVFTSYLNLAIIRIHLFILVHACSLPNAVDRSNIILGVSRLNYKECGKFKDNVKKKKKKKHFLWRWKIIFLDNCKQ